MGGGHGGIRGLGHVLIERWRQFEADCLRYYGVHAHNLDARQALVCLQGLPPDAAVWGPHTMVVEWRLQVLEMLDAVRIQVAALTGDKKVRSRKPVRFPRSDSWPPPQADKPQRRSWVEAIKDIARDLGGRR